MGWFQRTSVCWVAVGCWLLALFAWHLEVQVAPGSCLQDEPTWRRCIHMTFTGKSEVVLMSATLPHYILEITSKFMTDPFRILVKRDDLTLEEAMEDRSSNFFVSVGRHSEPLVGIAEQWSWCLQFQRVCDGSFLCCWAPALSS